MQNTSLAETCSLDFSFLVSDTFRLTALDKCTICHRVDEQIANRVKYVASVNQGFVINKLTHQAKIFARVKEIPELISTAIIVFVVPFVKYF